MKKLADFERTVNNLQEILEESGNSIVRDAAIKRYELCYELAWKSIQEAMRELGLEVCKSPRTCFQFAFQQGWISDQGLFVDMMRSRNLTTHTYDEDLAESIYAQLPQYLIGLQGLLENMQK